MSATTEQAVAWALVRDGRVVDTDYRHDGSGLRYIALKDDAVRPLIYGDVTHPAPRGRVVTLDRWKVVMKNGEPVSILDPFNSEHEARERCKVEDRLWAPGAPHRVMRLALVGADAGEPVSNAYTLPTPARAEGALTEAQQDDIEHAEGERIFDRVCEALNLDPNDGDCDSGDHADFIVSAVKSHIERLTAPTPARAEGAGEDALEVRLHHAGFALANCAYNLAQSGHVTKRQSEVLDKCRREWDDAYSALTAARAQEGTADA